MSGGLKLVSLNVEYSRHIDSSIKFLFGLKPNVACIQELYERDVTRVARALGSTAHFFVPMTRHAVVNPPESMGIGIFSRSGIMHSSARYYRGNPDMVPSMDPADPATYNNKNQMVAFCEIKKDGVVFNVGTTHFTWTPDGEATDMQREDMRALLKILKSTEGFILSGDFNAPRGGELWQALSDCYKDNVPRQYATSIDGSLHLRGQLNRMVDGIFSTPAYVVSDVELISGVSDHMALVATISKTAN